MKKIIFGLFLLVFAFNGFSQNNPDAAKVTKEMTGKYNLSKSQQAEMLVIQNRKIKNLSEIQGLKDSDRDLYYKKLKSINLGHEHSLMNMFNEEQKKIFAAEMRLKRNKQAEKMKKMKAKGASMKEIQKALIEND